MGTMNILSQVARDISWKYRNGSIDCSLTYEEFVREMARCPEELGDPPTRPELMNPLAPVVDSVSTVVREQATSDIMNSHRRTVSSPSSNQDGSLGNDQNERYSALEKLSLAELKELCVDRNEKISGSKKDLIDRLLQERKPEILLTRARRNQYVPKVPSSNAALLVALLLNHTPGTEGLSKERLMLLAEETGVSKDPMGGKGGWYDGWSGMKEMTSGDPPLVSVIKKKYSLTTQPFGGAGVDVATALHILAHRQSICRCGTLRL
jgi:flagellar motility protein MotE (MotC chaperone)